MGDIVERLRGNYVTGLGERRDFSPYVLPISLEAADEITRLTQELEAAEAKGRNKAIDEISALLREGAEDNHKYHGGPDACPNTCGAILALSFAVSALKAPAIGSQGTEKGRG